MDKNDFPFEEIIPEVCISKNLHVSHAEFNRCALCGLFLIQEEIKAHLLCDPELLDVCPKCQIKSKHMAEHIAKPAFTNADEWFLSSLKEKV